MKKFKLGAVACIGTLMFLGGCATGLKSKPEILQVKQMSGMVELTVRVSSTDQTAVTCSINIDGQKVATKVALILSEFGTVQITEKLDQYKNRPLSEKSIDCAYGGYGS